MSAVINVTRKIKRSKEISKVRTRRLVREVLSEEVTFKQGSISDSGGGFFWRII